MKDPPRNVFGPNHVVSPDMYAEFHRTGPYDRFLHTFSKLSHEERISCFETNIYFQGKMGLLLRSCDRFCEATNMFELFKHMHDIAKLILNMPNARLWQLDRERSTVVCMYNNSIDDPQNGRTLPYLGCFPGEVARTRKVVICNDATNDSRFGSWQYKEMQDELKEPLGTIIGVALMEADGQTCRHVFEAYRPDVADPLLDGADAFLLQTLGDYAGAAAVAIRQRWEQMRVAQLPSILFASDSFAGFVSRLRDILREWFECQDIEVFVYSDENANRHVWIYEDRALAANADEKQRSRSVMDRVVTQRVPQKKCSLGGKGIALEIAKQALETKGNKTHMTDNAPRDTKFAEGIDSKCRHLLTSALTISPEAKGSLVAVLQLRDRVWRPSWREKKTKPDDKFLAKCSGFTTIDSRWLETLRPHLTHALLSAQRKEETRLNKLQARMADRRALAIMTITNAIAQGLPIDTLFPTVVQEVTSLLNCDRATMWLLTPDRSKLWSMVQPFPPRKDSSLIRLEVPISNKSLSGSCALNDEVINLPDAYDDARFDRRFDKQTGYRTRSMLMVPITSEQSQDVLGCLQCLNKQNYDGVEEGVKFEAEDVALVQAFTAIAAVAIMQAKLETFSEFGVSMAIKTRAGQS